jgi:hypothetical protein
MFQWFSNLLSWEYVFEYDKGNSDNWVLKLSKFVGSIMLIDFKKKSWITFSIWQISIIWTFQLSELNIKNCRNNKKLWPFEWLSKLRQWNSVFFCILIDYRGHHIKGIATYNATWVNLQQKLWFRWTKNVSLNTTESFKQEKLYSLTSFLPWIKISVGLFRGALYMLKLLLHKDALFHCNIKIGNLANLTPKFNNN